MCSEFLDLLLWRQSDGFPVFKVLLTTSGQSETLFEKTPVESMLHISHDSRQVHRTGQVIQLQLPNKIRMADKEHSLDE